MTQILSHIRRAVRLPCVAVINRQQIQQIRKSGEEAVANAISEVLSDTNSIEEQQWCNRIEELRDSLQKNHQPLSITDHGAGTHQTENDHSTGGEGETRTITMAQACQASSRDRFVILLLKLVRHLRPENCLELGTNLGISAAYISAGLELNQTGKLVTIEGDEAKAQLASNHLRSLELNQAHVEQGRFEDRLETALKKMGTLDFAFIDGHHEGKATWNYYQQVLPYASGGAVILFDDIHWSEDMISAWNRIQKSQQVRLAVNCGNLGICVIGKQSSQKCAVRIRLR